MPSDVAWTAACRSALPPSPAAGIASERREMVGLLSELEQSSHPNPLRSLIASRDVAFLRRSAINVL